VLNAGFRLGIFSLKQLLQHHVYFFLMNLILLPPREGMTILE